MIRSWMRQGVAPFGSSEYSGPFAYPRGHISQTDPDSPVSSQLGDCHEGTPDGSCMNDWHPYNGNVTVSRYAFELTEVFTHERITRKYPDHKMHLFAHSPDAANAWDFYPHSSWRQKKQDAVLFGYEGSFYPLRSKISAAIRDGHPTPVTRFGHPGYGISQPESALTNRPKGYELGSSLHVNHVKTRDAFAQGMRDARICVVSPLDEVCTSSQRRADDLSFDLQFDSSLERKMIRK